MKEITIYDIRLYMEDYYRKRNEYKSLMCDSIRQLLLDVDDNTIYFDEDTEIEVETSDWGYSNITSVGLDAYGVCNVSLITNTNKGCNVLLDMLSFDIGCYLDIYDGIKQFIDGDK